LYYESAKIADAAVWKVTDCPKDVEEVELGIFEGLQNLVGFELFVFDPGLIILKSDDYDTFLVIGKELGCDRRVWHEHNNDYTPAKAEGADYDKLEPPGWD